MNDLLKNVPPQQFFTVLVVVISIVVFMLKTAPTVYRWLTCLHNHVNDYERINSLVKQHSLDIERINQELNKNESYHQHIKSMIEKQQAMMEDSIAEREIMLKGILTIIKSLNEPNGINSIDTKSIERDINEFLIKKCHK